MFEEFWETSKPMFSEKTMDKIFETIFIFHMKLHPTEKVQFLFFSNFLQVVIKLFGKLFGNYSDNLCIPLLSLIIMLFQFQRRKNLVKYQEVAKYYDHDCNYATKLIKSL